MSFLALDTDVIEHIAFWCGSMNRLLPPSDTIALASTCHTLHNIVLGPPDDRNYAVLGRIARFRYSTSAPRRRLGANFNSRKLAFELSVRVCTLRRVRDGLTSHLRLDLSVLYAMCIEDDGANIQQLNFVRANYWVANVILQLRDNLEIARLALAVYSILGTVMPLTATEDTIDEEQLSLELQSYGFASLQYMSTFRDDSLLFYFWGDVIYASPPPLTISAAVCLSIDVDRSEVLDDRVIPLKSERFDPEYYRLIMTQIALTWEGQQNSMHSLSPSEICWYGSDRLWTPGALSGTWVGECNTPKPQWYLEKYLANLNDYIDLRLGRPIEQDGALQRMKLSLYEHVSTSISAYTWSPTRADGTLRSTWFHELAEEASRTSIDKMKYILHIRDAHDPAHYTRYHTVFHKDDPYAPNHEYQCHDYDVVIEMPCSGRLPLFASSQVISTASLSDSSIPWEMGPTTELLPVTPKAPEQFQVDVVLTGQIEIGDHKLHIFGRIGRTDGLVTLITHPDFTEMTSPSPESPRWIFHGYLISGYTLVGRWVENPMALSSDFQGTFILKRGLSWK